MLYAASTSFYDQRIQPEFLKYGIYESLIHAGFKGPLSLCPAQNGEIWGDGVSSLCSLCQWTKLHKSIPRVSTGHWNGLCMQSWGTSEGSMQSQPFSELNSAVPTLLWEKQILSIIWVKNLPRRHLLCSAVPEVNFRASKTYDCANQLIEDIYGKYRHLVLSTSCPGHL